MAKREVKGFAGRLKLRGRSPVWIAGLNILEGDKVRIVSTGGNVWEGTLERPIVRRGGTPKVRTVLQFVGDGTDDGDGSNGLPIRFLADEDIADLTVTVGPAAGFPGPDAGSLDVPSVVIDGP